MGIRDWFSKKPALPTRSSAPSPEHPTPLSAIEAMLVIQETAGDDGDWITFSAGPGGNAVIEVSGDQINFCKREVDLDSTLRGAGLAGLAMRVRADGRKQDDRTLWTLSDSTAKDLALVVHAAFARSFGLGDSYPVECEKHC